MPIKYKLVQRKDFSKDAPKDSKKYYASIVSNGTVTLEELCEGIAEETTLTSADVKSCLDRLPHATCARDVTCRRASWGVSDPRWGAREPTARRSSTRLP